MSNLRGTTKYVFTSDDLIGRGATCEVYRGINKVTGEVHALKIFDDRNQMSFISRREIEALKALKHENIVEFLGEDNEGSGVVAVMEFCDKSLYNMLCEPEHRYGLIEEEFMRLFKHLVAGMKHLREHDFLHRDIKPGNILVTQDEDGSFIYKLSDFGTAKPVMETEAFQSLVGTEEYLHPHIFQAAFIDKHVQRKFDAAADLWSVGATLYHSATGKVPFQPYDGRNDKKVMFDMITRKEHGVISGQQKSYNSPIEWKKELPNTCRYSRWLRQALTEVLAGLLEVDELKAWNFDKFFLAAEDIVSRQVLYVFSTKSAGHFCLYLNTDAVYQHVQQGIQEETGIAEEDQKIRYEECRLQDLVTKDQPVSQYPRTTTLSPIIVMQSNMSVTQCQQWDESVVWYLDCRRGSPPSFNESHLRIDADLSMFKMACEGIAMVQSWIHQGCITQTLFEKLISTTERWTSVLIGRFSQELDLLKERLKDLSQLTKAVESCCILVHNSGGIDMKSSIAVKQMKKRLTTDYELRDKIKDIRKQARNDVIKSCSEENACEKKISRLLQQAKDKRDVIQVRKGKKKLPYHEEQLHKFDRKQIRKLFDSSMDLWSDHCVPKLTAVHKDFLAWQRHYANLQHNLEDLQRDLFNLRVSVKAMVKSIKVTSKSDLEIDSPPEIPRHLTIGQSYKRETLAKSPPEIPRHLTICQPYKKETLAESLEEVKSGQREIKELIHMNKDLVNQSMSLMSMEEELNVVSSLPPPATLITGEGRCQGSNKGSYSKSNVSDRPTEEGFTMVDAMN